MVCNSVVVKLVGGISPTDCNNLLYRLEFLLLRPFLLPRSTGNADADADEEDETSHNKAKQDTSPTTIILTRTPRPLFIQERGPWPLIIEVPVPRKRWQAW